MRGIAVSAAALAWVCARLAAGSERLQLRARSRPLAASCLWSWAAGPALKLILTDAVVIEKWESKIIGSRNIAERHLSLAIMQDQPRRQHDELCATQLQQSRPSRPQRH